MIHTSKQLFTAVGKVSVTTVGMFDDEVVQSNFQHVVEASSSDEACDKVIDYYIDKGEGNVSYAVDEIEIFDFIK